MSKTSNNIKIPYPTEGVIRTAQLNDTVSPENSVQLAVNMNFDRIGSVMTRKGISIVTTFLSGEVKALASLSIQSTGVKGLFGQVANKIYFLSGITWTLVRTLTSSTIKARFSQFLDYVWMVNGNGVDPVKTSNGGAFGTTLVPAGFPTGDYIQAGFEGRVWVADKSTDTIYYTDIVQFTPPSTYTLTFTLATNFIKNLSPQDGESITGLFRVPRALLVFKQNHIYRVYGAFSVDSYPAYNVGTYSQESIVQAKDGLYFHHPSGFYKFTYDSQPTEISRRVIDFVKAIPRSSYENIVGSYDGLDAVEWAIGSITVDGVVYAGCMMRYTISTQIWTIYDYAGNNITAMVRYDNGTTLTTFIGTDAGKVGTLDTGPDDFGTAIYYELIDRWRSFTDMYAHAKALSGMAVATENGSGAQVQYQTDKDDINTWTDIDTIDENYISLFPNMSTGDFNRFRFRIKGFTRTEQMIFNGVEFLSLQDKGLNEN